MAIKMFTFIVLCECLGGPRGIIKAGETIPDGTFDDNHLEKLVNAGLVEKRELVSEAEASPEPVAADPKTKAEEPTEEPTGYFERLALGLVPLESALTPEEAEKVRQVKSGEFTVVLDKEAVQGRPNKQIEAMIEALGGNFAKGSNKETLLNSLEVAVETYISNEELEDEADLEGSKAPEEKPEEEKPEEEKPDEEAAPPAS